jgi:hypothetical protein
MKETMMKTTTMMTIAITSLLLSCAANAALLGLASWWLRFPIWSYADLYFALRVYTTIAGL